MKVMRAAHWEHFPHDADVGVRGIGPTKEAAFEQAALALTAAMTELSAVAPATAIEVRCSAPDDELLLVDWLNAIIYEIATRNMLFSRYQVTIADGELRATIWGEAVDVARHAPAVEAKGATLTGLEVDRRSQGGWRAQCVVDV
ncbi:MAG: archease [Alphaproteobacteria bacterium]